MPNNILAGPNSALAKETETFVNMGLSSANVAVIYEVGPELKMWVPGSEINGITGCEAGKGYYIIAKSDLDLTAYFAPPLPSAQVSYADSVYRKLSIIEDPNNSANEILRIGYSKSDIYTSGVKIAIIGDSQGTGSFQTTGNSLQDLLEEKYPSAVITNYCVSGYNSRRIIPSGAYIDATKNITKAISDGNTIVICCMTSNDADASNSAGGKVPNMEYLQNLATIDQYAYERAVDVFFISSAPRHQLNSAAQEDLRAASYFILNQFKSRCAYVYMALASTSNSLQLSNSLQTGDNIHWNDAGMAVVFQILSSVLDRHYILEANSMKAIDLYLSNTSDGDYVFFQRVTGNERVQAKSENWYKAKAIYWDDSESSFTQEVQGIGSGVENQSPVVSAGSDQSISLPSDSAVLVAEASDPDGAITEIIWTQISGPNTATIESPSQLETIVSGLIQGTYVFRISVEDDDGASAFDEVSITVESVLTFVSKFNFSKTANVISGFTNMVAGPTAVGNLSVTDSNGVTLITNAGEWELYLDMFFALNNGEGGSSATSPSYTDFPAEALAGAFINAQHSSNNATNTYPFHFTNLPAGNYQLKVIGSIKATTNGNVPNGHWKAKFGAASETTQTIPQQTNNTTTILTFSGSISSGEILRFGPFSNSESPGDASLANAIILTKIS